LTQFGTVSLIGTGRGSPKNARALLDDPDDAEAREAEASLADCPRLSGVEEFEILLVDYHVLAEGDCRGLGAADEVHPAPGLAGGVVFLDDRLVVLERCKRRLNLDPLCSISPIES
jgi:hypothetical protein